MQQQAISDFGFTFDTNQVERKPDYVDLPDGTYAVKILEAERKVSKTNENNWYMQAIFEILAGPFAGRKHYENFNLGNVVGKNPEETRARALSDLTKMADAIGFAGALSGMGPLIGKPFCIEMKTRKQKDSEGNEEKRAQIQKYLPASAYSAAGVSTPAVPAGFANAAAVPAGFASAAPVPPVPGFGGPGTITQTNAIPATALPPAGSGLPWGNQTPGAALPSG